MKNIVKFIPVAIFVLGIIGATVEPVWAAGSVCCGVITIISVLWIADDIFNKTAVKK